ncbi:MAG: rhomboid family intramembrane serine protease [Planctomycetes bacterium]|nr:rhomboid family intramembrane serine protease [Planctomycetota bacterium]
MADWYFRNKQNNLKPCPGCRNLVRSTEEFCPYCARRLREEGGLRGGIKKILSRPFAASRSLVILIGAVFVLQFLADLFLPAQYRSGSGGGFFSLLTASPITYIRMGSNFHVFVYAYQEYWRFLTSVFLHFGLIHILFNCWAFWDLGRLAEKLWGSKEVFATFILTGIVGAWTSYGWHMYVSSPVNSAGASGAICGILGLLLGAYYRNRWQIGQFLGSQLMRWAVYIIIFGLVAGADNAAHIGGMISGAALGYFLAPTSANSANRVRDSKIWNILAGLSLLLLVVCFVFAVVFYLQGPELVTTMLRF